MIKVILNERERNMYPLTQSKNTTVLSLVVPLALVCFGLSPAARALLPPPVPDGGYPGFNTAEGSNALHDLTTGTDNTALGDNALLSNKSGSYNTATGSQALRYNTTANYNTATGEFTLATNQIGEGNTATGAAALYKTTAGGNTATGAFALAYDTTGSENTATGFEALSGNNTGRDNTATGYQTLASNNSGNQNTATGKGALTNNKSGSNNTANGLDSLYHNDGGENTADGVAALHENTSGRFNTANGYQALYSNQAGTNNTADGSNALLRSTGSNNVALGANAGINLTTGNNNIDIGAAGVAGESAKIRIGKQGTQNGTFIAGIYGVAVTGSQVVVNSGGKLGVPASSARFKDDIKPMDEASEVIHALKPVTFHYKKDVDPDRTPQFGLVAEEVEKVNPSLVAYDPDGKPYTVRYDAVNAMLLNEFLKEHRRVRNQEATIAQLKSAVAKQEATAAHQQKQIETLSAGLRKVSAQVEVGRSAPQLAANNQ
jgi:trimeric autotransporter adhesin